MKPLEIEKLMDQEVSAPGKKSMDVRAHSQRLDTYALEAGMSMLWGC